MCVCVCTIMTRDFSSHDQKKIEARSTWEFVLTFRCWIFKRFMDSIRSKSGRNVICILYESGGQGTQISQWPVCCELCSQQCLWREREKQRKDTWLSMLPFFFPHPSTNNCNVNTTSLHRKDPASSRRSSEQRSTWSLGTGTKSGCSESTSDTFLLFTF